MAEIRVEHLHKAFGDFAAVKESTFTIDDGSFFCLLGPSGCGKTTTLRMIAGLELPTSGRIFLDGEDVAFRRASERDIAFVFQLFALYPHMNVRQNIAFPLKCQGVPSAEIRSRVEETARLLRIDHLIDKPVSGLSGGDRQRVALGRAIVRRPKAFLMDEPLGTLDSEFRHLMCQELRALHKRIGATTVYVTHDQLEAMSMADTIAIMNHGVVEQIGPPQEVYDRPATMFVADFVGSPPMNFLPVAGPAIAGAISVEVDGARVAVPRLVEDAPSRELVLGVRPEHIRLDDASKLRAEVAGAEYLGTTQILTLKSAAGGLKARVAASHRVARGDTVGLSFEAARLSLFDKATGRAIRSALHENAAAPAPNRSRRPQAPGAAHG
jgi:multiple sugar transport system ATP-binding protein